MGALRGQQASPVVREIDRGADLWAPRRRRAITLVRRRRNFRSAVVLVGCCLALAVVATLYGSEEPARTPPVASGTIIWAGRVFTTPNQLRSWLESRGVSYRNWVALHPQAAVAQEQPQAVVPRRSNASRRVVVITRAVVVTLLAFVGYLMLPVGVSFRRFGRRTRLSA